jgi:hypothetical protein
MNRQCANHYITGLNDLRIEMIDHLIHNQTLRCRPIQRTRMTGNEKGDHASSLSIETGNSGAKRLADKHAIPIEKIQVSGRIALPEFLSAYCEIQLLFLIHFFCRV